MNTDGKWIKMSYQHARKISHNNGIQYVRIHDDKKQIVMNQVITMYGKSSQSAANPTHIEIKYTHTNIERETLRQTERKSENKLFIRGQFLHSYFLPIIYDSITSYHEWYAKKKHANFYVLPLGKYSVAKNMFQRITSVYSIGTRKLSIRLPH